MTMETFNLQVRIPHQNRDALKAIAALKGITMRQLINEEFERIISDAEQAHGLKLSESTKEGRGDK